MVCSNQATVLGSHIVTECVWKGATLGEQSHKRIIYRRRPQQSHMLSRLRGDSVT